MVGGTRLWDGRGDRGEEEGNCSQGTFVQTTNINLNFSLASIFLSHISVGVFFFYVVQREEKVLVQLSEAE